MTVGRDVTSVLNLKCTNIHILVIMRTKHFLKVKLKQINQDWLATTAHVLYIYNCIEYCFYILWKHGFAIFLSVRRIRVCSLRNSD